MAKSSRLTANPGRLPTSIGVLPQRRASPAAAATTSGEVRGAAMISTRGITGGGLKKCRPTTRSGRPVGAGQRLQVQAGGVAGDHRPRRQQAVEGGQDGPLQVEALGDRLDGQVRLPFRVRQPRHGTQAPGDLLRVAGDLAAALAPADPVAHRVDGGFEDLARGVVEPHAQTRLQKDLGDPSAHGAGADDEGPGEGRTVGRGGHAGTR